MINVLTKPQHLREKVLAMLQKKGEEKAAYLARTADFDVEIYRSMVMYTAHSISYVGHLPALQDILCDALETDITHAHNNHRVDMNMMLLW